MDLETFLNTFLLLVQKSKRYPGLGHAGQKTTNNRAKASNSKPKLEQTDSAPVSPATSVTPHTLSTATGTVAPVLGPKDRSSSGERGPLSQKEMDRHNRLGSVG